MLKEILIHIYTTGFNRNYVRIIRYKTLQSKSYVVSNFTSSEHAPKGVIEVLRFRYNTFFFKSMK